MSRKGKDGELTIVKVSSIDMVVVFSPLFVGRHISVVNCNLSLFNISFARI